MRDRDGAGKRRSPSPSRRIAPGPSLSLRERENQLIPVSPESTARVWPVTYTASSLMKNSAA
jgi:hypothetical protein